MKELEPHNLPFSEKSEINNVVPDKRENLIVSLKPKRGHRLFELNLATKVINEVRVEKGTADFKKAYSNDFSSRNKVLIKENCLYCTALNAPNADRKFFKMLKLKYPKNKK